MPLINPAFSTELLYELLKDEESLALLLKQDLMELVNYLSEFCKETESLNKKQLEELSRHPKEIRNGLEVVLTQIPKEWQASFLSLVALERIIICRYSEADKIFDRSRCRF